jgi:hypothetical protein
VDEEAAVLVVQVATISTMKTLTICIDRELKLHNKKTTK